MSPHLLADLGGTNIRFALSDAGGPPRGLFRTAADNYPDFETAALDYLGARRVAGAAICVAGPVDGGRVTATNRAWSLDIAAVGRTLGIGSVRLFNDFEAQALALPQLAGSSGLRAINPLPAPVPGAAKVVLGPGTGLGAAALVPGREGWAAVPGEAGHMTMAAANEGEAALLAALRERFGHVSAERVVSGEGLVNLHRALDGDWRSPIAPAEVTHRAKAGDATARAAVAHFTAFLGTVAADLALAFAAKGGVHLSGGIIPKLGELFDGGAFRRRFETKGRFGPYLAAVPTLLVTEPEPALTGLAASIRSDPS